MAEERLRDAENWPILAGARVRIKRPGLRAKWGEVQRLDAEKGHVYVVERSGKNSIVKPEHCTVVRRPAKQRRRMR